MKIICAFRCEASCRCGRLASQLLDVPVRIWSALRRAWVRRATIPLRGRRARGGRAPEVGGSQLTFFQLLAELGAWGLQEDGRRPYSDAMPQETMPGRLEDLARWQRNPQAGVGLRTGAERIACARRLARPTADAGQAEARIPADLATDRAADRQRPHGLLLLPKPTPEAPQHTAARQPIQQSETELRLPSPFHAHGSWRTGELLRPRTADAIDVDRQASWREGAPRRHCNSVDARRCSWPLRRLRGLVGPRLAKKLRRPPVTAVKANEVQGPLREFLRPNRFARPGS